MSPKQKALLLPERKGKFVVDNIDIPKPGPGELLAEVQAAALNPGEQKAYDHGVLYSVYPAIFGNDGASIVKEVGEGVTNFAVGDRILHQGNFDNKHATWQQYTIVPAEFAAKIPSHLSFEQAASLPITVATASLGLYNTNHGGFGGIGLTPPWAPGGRGKYAGQPILVIGGASSVGQHVIQFAKLSGFSPIITTASAKHESYLKSIGATHVVDRNTPLSELSAVVKKLTNAPLQYVYDAVSSAETQNAAFDALADGGHLAIVLGDAVDKKKPADGKEVVNVVCVVQGENQRAVGRELYKHFTALLEAGDIKPNNIEVLPNGLAGIPGGFDKLRSGAVSATKLVVRIADTP